MKSWKTTVGGILAAAGLSMQASADGTIKAIGAIVAGIGALILGFTAKDSNVTGGTTKQ